MANHKKLTEAEKIKILAFRESGLTVRKIADKIGCNNSNIVRFLQRYRETRSVERKKGTGPSRKTSATDDRHLRFLSIRDRFKTAVDLRAELHNDMNIDISVQTIRRRLRECGLNGRVPAKKPLLTRRMKAARLQWAKDHVNWTENDWQKVIFSDESKFNLLGSDGIRYVRRRAGERYSEECVVGTSKSNPSFMVWGCFSYHGVGPLCFIEGIVNAKKYKDILEENLLPFVEQQYSHSDEVIFQDDRAPCHTAKLIRDYLNQQGITRLTWPGNSPDLNPIENLWAVAKYEIGRRKPKNVLELRNFLENVWYNIISKELLEDLVKSMPHRIRNVILAKGGTTKY